MSKNDEKTESVRARMHGLTKEVRYHGSGIEFLTTGDAHLALATIDAIAAEADATTHSCHHPRSNASTISSSRSDFFCRLRLGEGTNNLHQRFRRRRGAWSQLPNDACSLQLMLMFLRC
mgnify:CR=1 FL=1